MSDRDNILQNVFDTISTGIFVINIESFGESEPENRRFRFVTANLAFVGMLPLSITSLAGLCPHDCLPPYLADRFCANYSRCIEQRQPISYEESFELETHSCTVLTNLFPNYAQLDN